MDRLILNVPKDVREDLRRLGRKNGRREAEVARDLLVRPIGDAQREEFVSEMNASQTPALRARLRSVAGALEKLRGQPR